MERKTEQDVVMRTWKTEMVRTCGEKDRARCSNENMEDCDGYDLWRERQSKM